MRGREKDSNKKIFQNNNEAKSSNQNTPISNAFSENTFASIVSTSFPNLPQDEATTLTTWQDNFSKIPRLPNNLAINYVDTTLAKHARIAYNPKTYIATTLNEKGEIIKKKEYKKSDPIAFILADQSMPGALKPAAARKHRFQDESKQEDVLEDAKGNQYVICPAHGDIVKVESLQTDHADSAKDILQRQCTIIEELNKNQTLADLFVNQFGLEELFVKVNSTYEGTLYFYERYYNDIDNLWNICQSCNLHKNDKDPLEWFKKNEIFGQAFIEYLDKLEVNNKGFIKTAGDFGLAEAAIKWYRDSHKDFINTTKKLYNEVIFKIQENLQKATKAVAEGNTEKANAYNAQAGLMTALTTMAANINFRISIEGTTPPTSPEQSQSTSDEDREILPAKPEIINQISEEMREPQGNVKKELTRLMKDNVRSKIRVKQHNSLSSNEENRATATPNDNLFKHHTKMAKYHKEKFEFHQKMADKYNPNKQSELNKTDKTSNSNITEPNINQNQMVSNKRKLTSNPSTDSNNNTDSSKKAVKTEKIIYGVQPSLLDLAKQSPIRSNQITNNTNFISTIGTFFTNKTSNTSDDAQMKTNNNTSSTNEDTEMNTNDNNNPTYFSPRPGSSNNK